MERGRLDRPSGDTVCNELFTIRNRTVQCDAGDYRMSFPYYFELFGQRVHPHPVFEVLAYLLGSRLYFYQRKRTTLPQPSFEHSIWLLTACLTGALIGAKLLAFLESPVDFWQHRYEAAAWAGGKTIVGGMLGAWLGVELAKKKLQVTVSTGDLYVLPLLISISIGRMGCFLTGLSDHTYGLPTNLPTGVDFGDGIRRHPTQLYEIAFLVLLGITLFALRRKLPRDGTLFRLFVASYLGFRFLIEFFKPRFEYALGLSAIQIASFCGCAFAIRLLLRGQANAVHSSRDILIAQPRAEN